MAITPVIIQVDEDENYHTVADLICYNMGLSISAKGRSISEAKDIIASIEAKRLIPDIAIISSMLEFNLEDGMKLAKKLRELVPGIKIIAYTSDDEAKWGDILVKKTSKDNDETLIIALEKLTHQEFNFSNAIK